jgi:hypothetical protein
VAGTRDQVELIPLYRAGTAVGTGISDINAMDAISTKQLTDRAECFCTDTQSFYQYQQDSVAVADGVNVIAPLDGGPGNWVVLSTSGGTSPFLTQSAWFVDSVTGDDTNSGATALTALKTLAELTRRWEGRTFSPTLTSINVTLSGSFPTEALVLQAVVPTAIPVEITASPSAAVVSGTLTGYQQSNSTLRGSITDAAQNFTGLAPRRIRITSGTVAGSVTWFNSIAAATTANTGQFVRIATPGATGAVANPLVGDEYVVEGLVTQIKEYDIRITGLGITTVSNLIIGSSVNTYTPHSYSACGDNVKLRLFGCLYLNPADSNQVVVGNQVLYACCNRGGTGLTAFAVGEFLITGHCHFGVTTFSTASWVTANRALHDGNGTANVGLFIFNSAFLGDIGDRGFFGNINGTTTAHIQIENFAQYLINAGSNTLWGAAGNTVTNAVIIRNGCGMSYATKPTATGAIPGNDVVLAGGAAIAWEAVPALAVSPDNAFANVRH